MAHAALPPSSAHRWMHCPGSVNLEKLFPSTSSPYAKEGTLAHAWAAYQLDPAGQNKPEKPLPEQHASYIKSYVDFIERETDGGFRQIEFRVPLMKVTGEAEVNGVVDCAALVDGTLKIIDLKFGEGVLVEAKNNPQLLIYALACIDCFSMLDDIKDIEMTIFQPRKDHIDSWKISLEEAKRLGENIRTKAANALQYLYADPLPLDALNPNVEACRFCRAKAACPKLRTQATQACDFKPLSDETPIPVLAADLMTPEKLAENLKLADFLEPWISAVREQAFEEAINGVVIPGFKLVLGRPGNRQWDNAKEAEEMLHRFKLKEDERYTRKIITPTQAEKLYKQGRIGDRQWKTALDHIVRTEPQPTLAPESDKREPWTPVSKTTDFSPISN